LSDSGKIIYNNFGGKIKYTRIDKLTSDIIDGAISNLIHKAEIDGKSREIVSSYYSTQLLQKDFGIIFSAPTGFFQKYIIRNSLYIVLGTLLLIQLIFFVFRKYFKAQQEEIRKRAESEKMLFRIIDEMPAGVIIYNKNREILMANKVAAVQYSYPGEEEMKGKIFPETSLPEISEYFSKNLGGAFNPEQFVIIHKDSSDIILSRNSIPIVYLGEEATMEILVDVTMLESERKQEARANVAKSEFLARMSYEIRTPLNGIIGMTDILHKKDISMEARELVSLLRRSAEELINIINDILDFSKIETGKMILDEVPFDVRDEITYCGDLARTFITEKGVILSYEIDENIPGSIISDPFRLRQILTNLISYSSSNTSEGEIRLGCKLVSNKKGHVTLGFEIADTGLRLDKASLNNDFGEMVSIESKTRREGDESVFGTILSKQLIEIMGGSLTAVSPSGLSGDKGTKIYFMINAYSNEKPSKNLNLEMIRSVGSIKTLVITGSQYRDEETLGILHKTGLNITVTTFHKSTIGQIKTNLSRPDDRYNLVVILDHPGFNGFDVAGAIWENNLSDKLILLMISSNDKKGNYLKCITNGIDHYLVRPFDNSDITRVLQESFPNVDHSLQVDMTNIRKDIGILIVEDNKMNQKIITAMLKNMGYSSDIAEDGYDGLVKAKTKKYDLIFMDLFMPEMNGYEAAQRILEVDKSVLIVAFTADNLPETKKKAELSGIKEFIIKPVRTTDIIRLLTKYFQVN
jgi:signal transduction histidine kinase/CheY-like chemotaxis protein